MLGVGATVSEAKTEIMCPQTKDAGKVSFTINAAGQVYKQTIEFVYLDGAISADRQITQRRDNAASSEGLGVLPEVQEMEIYACPGCALTVEGAVAEGRADRHTTLRLRDLKPKQA